MISRRQKAGGRRQEAEGRRQKAEGRRQKAGGRREKPFGAWVWVVGILHLIMSTYLRGD